VHSVHRWLCILCTGGCAFRAQVTMHSDKRPFSTQAAGLADAV